ncbi:MULTISPECIES: acetyltransferase [Sphingomonadaceae]|uniref:Acetyltransferase n=2 Tax=Sphingomonadaceae TaxID=41297 RepID=A0A5D9BZ91_9SPHN|nr:MULTISPECIES: acetyltransferase [Sphingomonadaceae]MBN9146143.1 acetyltransferase [Novosphingobium sp.]MBS86539.1 acetyltransferase [Sphingobium sp.]MCC4256825.1 acetyltransferase [Sphingobium lactosutens]MDH2133904.1 acetyltransferase [Sphingobium yanoikuyae]MDH2152923.1 acetyltransferase [Sphingobium yanoikuyae]
MLTIRKSNVGDGPRVMQIWREAVDATHDFLDPKDRDAIEQELSQFLPTAPLWLAIDKASRTVGFMLLDGSHMEALFIDPASRGQGVGRSLVEHACSLYSVISTDVNEQNSAAAGFYRRLGFIPTGRSEMDGQGRPYPLIHLQRLPSV